MSCPFRSTRYWLVRAVVQVSLHLGLLNLLQLLNRLGISGSVCGRLGCFVLVLKLLHCAGQVVHLTLLKVLQKVIERFSVRGRIGAIVLDDMLDICL